MEYKIKMDFSQATQTVRELEQESNLIMALVGNVNRVKNSCGLSGRYRTSIVNSLNTIVGAMEKESTSMKKMGTVLASAINTYESAEKVLIDGDITQWGRNINPSIPFITHDTSEEWGREDTDGDSGSAWAWKWKDTWKVISSGGIIGAGIAGIGNLITGNWGSGTDGIKTSIDSTKFLLSVAGGAATVIGKGRGRAVWLDYLLGKNDAFSKLDVGSVGKAANMNAGQTWTEIFKRSWDKQTVQDLKWDKTAGTPAKTKVITKWAGHALTAIKNGVENYQEWTKGGISAERAVAETVIETGVDIAVGAAATAAVTATIAAAATAAGITVAAPAVVVGIASAGVVWAANGVCKWITEAVTGDARDLGEVAADVVCNTVEVVNEVKDWTRKQARKVGEAAVEAVGNACSSARKWVSGLFGIA